MAVDMDGLTPDTRSAWAALQEAAARELGFTLTPRSARRTCAEQAEQYAIGRSGPDDTRTPTTFAKGCRSWHVTGRAIDFFVYLPNGQKSFLSSDYTKAGELAERLGWVWGGRFSGFGPNGDEGHVQWTGGHTIEEICPNPDVCVDVPASGLALAGGEGWGGWKIALGVLAGVAVLGGAVVGGTYLAKKYA